MIDLYPELKALLDADKLEEAVLWYARELGSMSFVEMERVLEGKIRTQGDMALRMESNPRIVLWVCSEEMFDLLSELLREGRLEVRPTNFLVYAVDGKMLKLPIAKSLRGTKRDRWLPACLYPRGSGGKGGET